VTAVTGGATGPVQRALGAVAGRLGCTEGQVQTIAIGLVVAVLTAVVGLPPVFEDRPFDELAAPAPAVAGGPGAQAPAGQTPPTVDAAVGGPVPEGSSGVAVTPPGGGGVPAPSAGDSFEPTRGGGDPPTAGPAPEQPADPATAAGQAGPCEVQARSIENPRRVGDAPATPVWIFEPSGDARAPIAGGACDDDERPVVLFAHGFGQTDPAGYEALIEHLVSVGNVVVYPVYEVRDGQRSSLEESHRVVDAGFVAAVAETPRADTTRVGVWGHSNGGGMVAFLTQQIGIRRWGGEALWLSNVAQAFSQLVGAGEISVPDHARAITVAFQHDAFADARLGNDVFRSLALPAAQKRHVTVLSDPSTGLAEHAAPSGTANEADGVDQLLWRYADLLQLCAVHGEACDADLSTAPGEDGSPVQRAIVSDDPVDVGPFPAILAECDAGFGPTLNPRIQRCGPTKL